MRVFELVNDNKVILTIKDIARILSVSEESAKVSAVRYVKNNLLFRLKKDVYITPQNFNNLTENKLFEVANLLQVPSYISLTTALSFYDITTQQLRSVIESVGLKRSKRIVVKEFEFLFFLVKKSFYTGFILKDGFFIATPEKALADAVYLTSISKYSVDFDAVNFSKLELNRVDEFITLSKNKKAKNYWEKLCKSYNL
jgi:predicted transcriptional regulator of viral defense system